MKDLSKHEIKALANALSYAVMYAKTDEVKEFENWYPLDEELPESIKEWNPNGDIKG